MHYDPILCMNIPDKVTAKDAIDARKDGFVIHNATVRNDTLYITYEDKLYGPGKKKKESFTRTQAKNLLTDPWSEWLGTSKMVVKQFAADSKTIDQAIKSCDVANKTRGYIQNIMREDETVARRLAKQAEGDDDVPIDEVDLIFEAFKKKFGKKV